MKKMLLPAAAVIAALSSSAVYAEGAAVFNETDNAAYTVYADKKGTPISPYIYGINDVSGIAGGRYTVIKQCDVAVSAYNWETNFSNSGAKDGNANDVSLIKGYSSNLWDTPALYTEKLMTHAMRNRIDTRLVTLQMMGRVAADSMGVVSEDDFTSRWDDISFTKNDFYTTKPDPSDSVIYIDEYLSYLVNKYSTASDGGINGYFLDREPDRWDENFPYTGLAPITPDELCSRSADLALTVKTIDGTALVFGPSLSSISGCIDMGTDSVWDKIASGSEYSWFVDYYLAKMKEAGKKNGVRLLDVLDVHYYTAATTPLGTAVIDGKDAYTDAYRMQAVRTLWDQNYTENSVTALQSKQYTPFIPTLQASIRLNYPDTKLSFSEYNFGGGENMSGAIAEAEALGTFAREGVYLACLAPGDVFDYQRAAIDLFTNYDGVGSAFGDTYLPSEGGDQLGALYCAKDKENRLTMVVTNQNQATFKNIKISINSANEYEIDSAYNIDRDTALINELDPDFFYVDGNVLDFAADPESAYMIVLREVEAPPSETEESTTEVTDVTDETEAGSEAAPTESSAPAPSETVSAAAVTEVTEVSEETPAQTEPEPAETTAEVTTAPESVTETEESFTEGTEPVSEEPPKQEVSLILKIIATLLAGCASFGTVYVLLSK